MEMRRVVVVVACVVGVLWLAPVSPAARATAGPIQAVAGAAASGGAMGGRNVLADFNADTYADLAVGVPLEDNSSGVVNVIYGSASGLSATDTPDQIWGQGSPSVEGNPEADDKYGSSLATGDFNGDDYPDLAIGVPKESAAGTEDGGVSIIYGWWSGLSATAIPDQFIGQDNLNVEGLAESYDHFGESLAGGDFNLDGYADLAIGVPEEDGDVGVVNVIYGSVNGLSPTAAVLDQYWWQGAPNVEGTPNSGDDFGESLATGHFNDDGYADLAIGVSGEDSRSGVVNVIYGSATGLSATAVLDQIWGQGSPDVEGSPANDETFGWRVAAGDFGGSGARDDLAIGVPFESGYEGAVNVIYGSASGLSATITPDQLWGQDTQDVEGVAEPGDWFGWSVVAADFGGSIHADLAIGVPDEDTIGLGLSSDDGGVNVIYGSATGLSATTTPDQLWRQDTQDVEDTTESGDSFGESLAAGDFNGDGDADLAIGVPEEDGNVGVVNVIYGSAAGLSATTVPDQLWYQGTPDVEGTPNGGDEFGSSLTAT
jgi:hypothetical protein